MPDWVARLSPFGHILEVPDAKFHLAPLLAVTVAAIVLLAAGDIGYRERDIQGSSWHRGGK